MTTPPKHYTTDTLVKFMDNPFAKDEEIEDEDTMYANIRKGATIGKTSTRAEIINKAQKSGYISRKIFIGLNKKESSILILYLN